MFEEVRMMKKTILITSLVVLLLSGCNMETAAPDIEINNTIEQITGNDTTDIKQVIKDIELTIEEISNTAETVVNEDQEHVIEDTFYEVQRIVDGDTVIILDENLTIDGSNKLVRIRALLIDTPEVHNGTIPEPFGPEASAYAKEILTNQKVRLEFDKEKLDPYGRTLAYIYLEDGRMFNEMLLEQGLAKVVVYQPNNKYEEQFQAIERTAQEGKIGIWSIN